IRDFKNESMRLTASNTAKIEASGACKSLTAIIHDDGQLNASRFECEEVNVEASGKSTGIFSAKKTLKVVSGGDSRVEYLGTPEQINEILSERSSVRPH